MLLPVLVNVFVIGPVPVSVLPVMFATAALVHVKTVLATSLVDVKFSWSPLQMVAVDGRLVNVGVGLTTTLVVWMLVVQPLPLAVNV